MQFFPSDWINGTRFLTHEEKGIYIDMIAMSWDKPIPKERLPFLIKCTWDDLSDYVKENFLDLGDTVIDKRVYKDISTYEEYIEKQKINGAKGGRPKTQKNLSNSNSNTNSISNTITNSKIPTEQDFLEYGYTILKQLNKDPENFEFSLKAKYHSWVDDGWKTGHGKKIKNWKNTLNNTIPHIKPIYNGRNNKDENRSYREKLLRDLQS